MKHIENEKLTQTSSEIAEDIKQWLSAQKKDVLVGLLMEQVVGNDRLYQKLLLKVAKRSTNDTALKIYRESIDEATYIDGFIDYRATCSFADGIEQAIAPIVDLIEEGHFNDAIELSEYALVKVEEALNSVDDSNGSIGGILCDLQGLHYSACLNAKPDQETLAKRLFDWELNSDWETFYDAAEKYAEILGKKGLAIYQKLAEQEWIKVPALAPGQEDDRAYRKRFRITNIMETLAEQTGDIEALIAVKKHNLSNPYRFLNIAEIYSNAVSYDQALHWAERGVKEFPEETDSRLSDFLAEEYYRRGRYEEAMKQIWTQFSKSPCLSNYQKLKEHGDRIEKWLDWRDKALICLRESIAKLKQRQADSNLWSIRIDHSTLVEIFLWEKDFESAWEEAKKGDCNRNLWLQLADKRAEHHPEDAIMVYKQAVEPILDLKNNDAYKKVANILVKIRVLMLSLNRQVEFNNYFDRVRKIHKIKRNFMKILDDTQW